MNTIGYFEIQSDEPLKAVEFYSSVFGWKSVRDTNIPTEYYRIEGAGMMGAILKAPQKKLPFRSATNAFTCSIQVEDYDVIAEKIVSLGGIEIMPKFAVQGKCWQGYYVDLDKNEFGIFQVDANTQKEYKN